MSNLLQQVINCGDADLTAKVIQDALGIESVVNYCFPTTWPADRERRARIFRTEARYLGSLPRPRRFPRPWTVEETNACFS